MKIREVHLNKFKRFTDLMIKDIPESAKLVILVGPNGSGKSTLLHMMSTYLKPKSGKIYLGDKDLGKLKQKEIEDAIAIPSEAIVPEMGKNKVFVYRSGVADPVDVIIGLRTEAEVQIVRGLSVGDTILTSGTLQLRKGMPVELQAIN